MTGFAGEKWNASEELLAREEACIRKRNVNLSKTEALGIPQEDQRPLKNWNC